MKGPDVRVLCVVDSLVGGGAETSLLALAAPYAARGVRLEVAYLKDRPGLQDDFRRAGAELLSLAGPGGRIAWIRRTAELLRRRKPDLVHTTLYDADVVGRTAAALCRIPVVSSLVNVQYGPAQLADPRLAAYKIRAAQALDALTARKVVRFHALTEHVAGTMSRRLLIRKDRIDVIGRGRDPATLGTRSHARREAARRRLGIARGTSVVLAAARQEYQKGLDVLLRALPAVMQRIPSAKLVVAGREGNATPSLMELHRSLKPSDGATFLGVRGDVPDLMCAADAFVLPSRWEGLGSVLLEAMALKAPIVASDLPAVREVVEDGAHARLVAPGDPEALAAAIIATLEAGDRNSAQTAAAYDRFRRHYAIDVIADRMIGFYERALAGGAVRRLVRTA